MMGKSVMDINNEWKAKYHTTNNTYDMFPVGTKVKVICVCQDFTFFFPETEPLTGIVVKNTGKYLGICVRWDEIRRYEGGYNQRTFNFMPDDMIVLQAPDGEFYEPTELEHAMRFANQMGICPEGDLNGKTEKRNGLKGPFCQGYKGY